MNKNHRLAETRVAWPALCFAEPDGIVMKCKDTDEFQQLFPNPRYRLLLYLQKPGVRDYLVDSKGHVFEVGVVGTPPKFGLIRHALYLLLDPEMPVKRCLIDTGRRLTLDELKELLCEEFDRHEEYWSECGGDIDQMKEDVRYCKSFHEIMTLPYLPQGP